mgnify:CR=1 FL=1
MKKRIESPPVITDSELIEALIAISMVTKNLAKKVMMLSIKKEKRGGEKDEQKRCDYSSSKQS